MSVSFPVSLPIAVPQLWQLPDGVVIVGFALVLGLLHLAVLWVVVQLLRRRRFHFLLVALAVYAWALGLWSNAAEGVASVRGAFGGSQTFDYLNVSVQLIFVMLGLVVLVAAWRRVQAARAAAQLPISPTATAAVPVPVPVAPSALPVDADAWLR